MVCCILGDAQLNMIDNDAMNPLVFNRSSLPLPTSIFKSITTNEYYHQYTPLSHHLSPKTYSGFCNIFLCNCDHCYGESNCMGTDDAPGKRKASEPLEVFWTLMRKRKRYVTNCPEELAPYLNCPPSTGRRLTEDTAASGSLGLSCSDKNLVLDEPLNATAARLTAVFCVPGGDAGLSFTGKILDTLDADKSGEIDCVEWGIAKMQATAEELMESGTGGYFGPAKLDPPACEMSAEGKTKLARYNAYLAELTMTTAAANTTA